MMLAIFFECHSYFWWTSSCSLSLLTMAQKYAVVEFQLTDDIAIVDVSTVHGVDSTKLASLPREAICDWKEKGKKKTKAYDVNVLRLEGMAYFRMLAASGTVIFVPHSY